MTVYAAGITKNGTIMKGYVTETLSNKMTGLSRWPYPQIILSLLNSISKSEYSYLPKGTRKYWEHYTVWLLVTWEAN